MMAADGVRPVSSTARRLFFPPETAKNRAMSGKPRNKKSFQKEKFKINYKTKSFPKAFFKPLIISNVTLFNT